MSLDQDITKLSPSQVTTLYTAFNLPNASRPPTIPELLSSLNPNTKTTTAPIMLQVVDIKHISKSSINQIDELLGIINPNESRSDKLHTGKQNIAAGNGSASARKQPSRQRMVREINLDQQDADNVAVHGDANTNNNNNNSNNNNNNSLASQNNKSYYKWTFADHQGNLIYAFELTKLSYHNAQGNTSNSSNEDAITAMSMPVPLGAKVIIRQGTKIMLDVLLLTSRSVQFRYNVAPSGGGLSQQRAAAGKLAMNRVILQELRKRLEENEGNG